MALYGTVLKVSSMALFTPGINMSFGQPLGPCNSVLRAKAYTRKQGIGPRGELGLSLREFTISRNCLVTDISHKCQENRLNGFENSKTQLFNSGGVVK